MKRETLVCFGLIILCAIFLASGCAPFSRNIQNIQDKCSQGGCGDIPKVKTADNIPNPQVKEVPPAPTNVHIENDQPEKEVVVEDIPTPPQKKAKKLKKKTVTPVPANVQDRGIVTAVDSNKEEVRYFRAKKGLWRDLRSLGVKCSDGSGGNNSFIIKAINMVGNFNVDYYKENSLGKFANVDNIVVLKCKKTTDNCGDDTEGCQVESGSDGIGFDQIQKDQKIYVSQSLAAQLGIDWNSLSVD